jgi:hypothetical protein
MQEMGGLDRLERLLGEIVGLRIEKGEVEEPKGSDMRCQGAGSRKCLLRFKLPSIDPT